MNRVAGEGAGGPVYGNVEYWLAIARLPAALR
jgi:hypothetical protein